LPPTEPTPATRILVVDIPLADRLLTLGLVVDRVIEVAPVAGTLDDAPPLFRGLAREYLQGILRREGGLVIVLDLARLLTATERIALQQALVDV
jgi:purine-binding chemotaxis protein CheW